MPKKLIKTDEIPLEIPYIYDCSTVGELKEFLTGLRDHLNSFSPDDKITYDYDGSRDMYIERFREETDAEYNYRMEKERVAALRAAIKSAEQKAKQEAKDREKYEKLKKKFEGK